MLRIIFFVIVPFILISISCQQTHDPIDSLSETEFKEDEKEVRRVVMKIWEDAANGDTTELKAVHLDSPKFTKFGPRIAVRQDVESTKKTETEHFASISKGSFDIEDLKVDIFGDVAITTFYNKYGFIKDNVQVHGKGRVTLVFIRTDEGWKIIHEHSSPFNDGLRLSH